MNETNYRLRDIGDVTPGLPPSEWLNSNGPRAEGQVRVRGYRKRTFTSMWAWSWS